MPPKALFLDFPCHMSVFVWNSGSLIPGSHQEDAGCRLGRPSRTRDHTRMISVLVGAYCAAMLSAIACRSTVHSDAIASFVLRLVSSGTAEELPMDSLFHCVITPLKTKSFAYRRVCHIS